MSQVRFDSSHSSLRLTMAVWMNNNRKLTLATSSDSRRNVPTRKRQTFLSSRSLTALSLLRHLFKPTYHTLQQEQPIDSDLELQPLAQRPSSTARSPFSRFRRLALLYSVNSDSRPNESKMKFSHSLLFNAVPDWNNHYLAWVLFHPNHNPSSSLTFDSKPQPLSCTLADTSW